MDLDDIVLVEQEEMSRETCLLLSGVKLKEEITYIGELCKKDRVLKGSTLPLYISYMGREHKIGEFEIVIDNIIALLSINPSYVLKLFDSASKDTRDIIGEDASMQSLTYFINLGDAKY